MKQESSPMNPDLPENGIPVKAEPPKKTIAPNSVSLNFVAITILLCTVLIIASVMTIAKKTTEDIRQVMNDQEYMKVGGEENYKLLREIQKDQMTSYIRDLSEKDPVYIESLKRKIKNLENGKKTLVLSPEEIGVLKDGAHVQWNTGALVTIVEFSNFACSFCRDFHNEWILRDILKKDQENANYLFKHIPSKGHPDATTFAQAGKCILSHTWGQSYVDFIDTSFAPASLSGSVLDIGMIYSFAEKAGVPKTVLDTCISSKEISESLDNDAGQGIFLGIKSTPSILLLNNKTGEYTILEGKVDEKTIKDQIDMLSK